MIKPFPFTSRLAFIIAGLLILCAVGGCNSDANVVSPAETAKKQEDTIREIENNKYMSPESKAKAIDSIRNPPDAQKHQEAYQDTKK